MSTYSSNLRIELITNGTQAGTWGDTTNSNLAYVLDSSIAGYQTVSVTSAKQPSDLRHAAVHHHNRRGF